jgi:hypothetical protein
MARQVAARFLTIMLMMLGIGVAACSEAPGSKENASQVASDVYVEPELLKTEKLRLWPEAASVRLFVEDIPFDEIGPNGNGMTNPAGTILTKAQQVLVTNAVRRETYSDYPAMAGCFVPHHFFRFYDARGRQLGELEVCYCCGGIQLNSSPHDLADRQLWGFDYDGVAKMMAEMGISSKVQCAPE